MLQKVGDILNTEESRLGETNLIYCSTDPTDPVFARKKKIIIWILRLAIYNSSFFTVVEDKLSLLFSSMKVNFKRSLVHLSLIHI